METLGYCTIDVYKTKDSMNECIMILIYCIMNFSKFQKFQLFLKYSLSIKNDYFFELYFRNEYWMPYNITIWLENGKNASSNNI